MTNSARCHFFLGLLLAIPGCRIAELTATDNRTYLIREDNEERRLRAIEICTHLFPPVAPAPWYCHVLLVEKVPIRTDTWSLSSTVRQTPPWRTLDYTTQDSLFHLAYSITANESENRRRFIIASHNPVIVAIGVDSAPEQKMLGASVIGGTLQIGMGLELVGEPELGCLVDKTILYNHGYRHVIALARPMTVREVLDCKLWEERAPQ